MNDDVSTAELALENARQSRKGEGTQSHGIRIKDAEQRLYKAQKRQFEASLRRRARLAKP